MELQEAMPGPNSAKPKQAKQRSVVLMFMLFGACATAFIFQMMSGLVTHTIKLGEQQIMQLARQHAAALCDGQTRKCNISVRQAPQAAGGQDQLWVLQITSHPPGDAGMQLHFDVYGRLSGKFDANGKPI
ncbi:hypothetical protein V8J88_22920 [Massilia sp. W12]|uniref:hypothetical protein n=1 Tax=Massilia sp. W12 TaxID=3126507 RepID=UPI0030CDE415